MASGKWQVASGKRNDIQKLGQNLGKAHGCGGHSTTLLYLTIFKKKNIVNINT